MQELDPENTKVNFMESTKATTGARSAALEHIREADDLYFKVMKEEGDVSYGDLIISKDSKHYSLTDELVNSRIISRNETMFQKGILELS